MGHDTVKTAAKTMFSAQWDEVLIYPDDYDLEAPPAQFVVIEEMIANPNRFVNISGWVEMWSLGIYIFVSAVPEGGEDVPGLQDAEFKTAAYTAYNTAVTLLTADPTIGGTCIIGHQGPAEFAAMIAPLTWNGGPYFGIFIEVPVYMDRRYEGD